MFYKVEVFDDGDIFITKTESKKDDAKYLHIDSKKKLRDELIEYGVNEIVEDLHNIDNAKMNQPIQCF
jgi:hypothetical protein